MCLICFVGLTAPVQPYRDQWMSVVPVPDPMPGLAGLEVGEVCFGASDQPKGTAFTCACELPSVQADDVFPYFDDMYTEDELDQHEVVNTRLIEWISSALNVSEAVIVFPRGEEDCAEGSAPRGTVELSIDGLNLRELFFVDGFLYRFSR